ncbi:sigma-70 family RNA polymerase sigma factor [Nocardioides bruguierae]|uniref:Sigma-70 family RNA polymerase sigma factor n=1 Tax=Nocardioides bruguierae TaxID=2945102 RepID=A0A9X2IFY9_9ACTN|nr:sigma-70 family RNA polymerase sigma factor [Nocardioides bruguierae]MCM0622326.1 sigma-70 family RNA polymerase sigma factor [Nocardioides bruguierae]
MDDAATSTRTRRPAEGAPPEESRTEVLPGLADEDEVHAAYLRHGPEIYRFLLRGLGDPGAAQDVTQETFLKAWRNADRFDPTLSSLRVWLFGIARNAMIDHARASGARPWQSTLLDPPSVAERAEEVADPTERMLEGWLLEEALRRVAEHHRTAIVETHLRERPYDEVAGELGVPVGTLRSRVFYGLKALRAAMDEMGVAP